MKAVILAGGYGSRLSEETETKPKPMIEIGGRPILWHIMKYYSFFGINEFIICCGYKSNVIKEYFSNYSIYTSDITFDLKKNDIIIHKKNTEPWKVTLVDTGENVMTGGRLKRVKDYLLNEEMFCFTYGDGLSNVNIKNLIKFHKEKKSLATVTAVRPIGRFGVLGVNFSNNTVEKFEEKPIENMGWINGGFFILKPKVFEYIENDDISWELEPMKNLVNNNMLKAFIHDDFWHPMDTIRDKKYLNELWASGQAPWKVWK